MEATEERDLARLVQATRRALFELLTEEEQKTYARKGSSPARTFEDAALEIIDHTQDLRSFQMRIRLDIFQKAVNALWIHAINSRLPERVARVYRKRHRKGMAWAEASAEATFHLRHFLLRYDPDTKEPPAGLENYATEGLVKKIREADAQLGPIELPRVEARKPRSSMYRTELDSCATHNPWPLVDRCIDEDHSPEDG